MIETILLWILIIVTLAKLSNKYYFSGGVCKSEKRLDGKVIIITGSNTGIGFEAALDLAKRGAKVILACRDLKKAQQACDKINLETNSDNATVIKLDLASLDSIKEFVKNFKDKFNRLDILINNAGLATRSRMLTKDGFEMHFGTMHLGHFYLTGLLIDMLKSSPHSRIVNVSSIGHKRIDLIWDDLQGERTYKGFKAYRRAKLANCLFTRELARKFGSSGITAVSLHPGAVNTEIFRVLEEKADALWILTNLLKPLIWTCFKTSQEGAQTTIHCAVDDDVPNYNGEYYSDCKVTKCSPQSKDMDSAKKLWEISEKLTGITY